MGFRRQEMLAVVIAAALAQQGCRSTPTAPPPTPAPPQAQRPTPAEPDSGALAPSPSQVSPPGADAVVARVGGQTITLAELREPLVEAYGLNVLLNLVQLELAEQLARDKGVSVAPEDVEAERRRTFEQMFAQAAPEDYDALFEQFLSQQRISRQEFDIAMRTNALLRAVSEPLLEGTISEENLQQAFGMMYGEKVQVRHVQLSNMQEVAAAQRRLEAGEAFELVAGDLSRNENTRALGGEVPPFSRATTGLPEAFKDAAFAMNEGEVSDAVLADDAYHLIKLERKIPPRAVKFEDVKESVREQLHARAVEATVRSLRTQLGQQALTSLRIEHPALRQQFEARRQASEQQAQGREAALEQMREERQRLVEQQMQAGAEDGATTTTTTQPASPDAGTGEADPTPAASTEDLRPPATGSGEPPMGSPDLPQQQQQPATVPSQAQ